jgi:phage recombination protein Bet
MENKELAKQKESQDLTMNPWSKLPVVKSCFAPTLSDDEFKIFVGLGMSLNANPFTREIWAVKYGSAAAAIFLGRDFYRRKAQEQPDYNGHIVNAVYENDKFSIIKGQPEHAVNSFKDRGLLIGAFCAVYKKDLDVPYFVTVRLDEYDKKQSNWKTMPETMIKKVAEAQALRGAYQGIFKGTYDESEEAVIKADAVDVEKMDYALDLLRTSNYINMPEETEIEAKINNCESMAELNKIINNLLMNQAESSNMSLKDINKKLDEK